MTSSCYSTGYRTVTSLSPTIVRSTSYRTSTITLSPTGTRLSPLVTTTRIPSVVTFTSQATRRSTYYTTTCTTYQARQTKVSYPYNGSYRAQVPTGLIVIAAIAGLWYAIFIGVGIYLICCSKTAKRERLRKKGKGSFSQPQYQQNLQPQQYTPVPQDPLYAQPTSQYPPPSLSSYGGVQQNLNPVPQTGYTGYQNYNAPNFGGQAPNQWNPNTPSASSFVSGSGPGYIPPGAAQPMIGGSPPPGTYAMMTSTTPSPPPGSQGPGSDPHRMLYTQQNDRLSAAVSLVHPYQQSPQEQPPLSSYPAPGPGPGPGYAQPYQTSSQTQLSGQYRGYAEPSTMNYGPGGRF